MLVNKTNLSIYLDISRLLHRSSQGTPSGIDRVLLAYYHYCIELKCSKFFYHNNNGLTTIDKEQCSKNFEKIEARQTKSEARFNAMAVKTGRSWRRLWKYFKRRSLLRKLVSNYNDNSLSIPMSKLDDLDSSAYPTHYKIHKYCKNLPKEGTQVFISVCHSMLSQRAYINFLERLENTLKVFFIHDTIPCDFPEYCRNVEPAKHKLRIINALKYSDHIIVNSQYTKDRLNYWSKILDLDCKPISVINIGVEEKKNLNATNPYNNEVYFVILGTIEPRKNHLLLLNIWKSLLNSPIPVVPKLIIIGRRGWEIEAVTRTLDRSILLRNCVIELTNLADEEMWPILQGAQALLFPSFVEGWGMPLVEALHNGVPTICSDIPALREAGQDLADYCSPLNGEAWKDLIMDYVENPEGKRAEQIERIKKFKAPTWQKHFEDLESIINNIQQ